MRFPSLPRREEPAQPVGDDADRTGAVSTDTRSAARPVAEKSGGSRAWNRRGAATGAERAAGARAATARSGVDGSRRARAAAAPAPDSTLDPTLDRDRSLDTDVDRTAGTDQDAAEQDRVPTGPPAPAGPRPRASLLATLGLVVGVAGLLFVLTGTLAGYGIGLGAAGAVLAVLGLVATRRRHIAGKSDALLGIAFGLGAVVLGVLAMSGQFDWPTTDGDTVTRFREWLDSQVVDRF